MSRTPWRPLLRIARRDALRAKGRSALVVAMVALPVLALSSVDVLARSAEASPEQQVTARVGSAQAELTPVSGVAVQQSPDALSTSITGEEGDAAPLTLQRTAALLPAGTPRVTWSSRVVSVRTATGTGQVSFVETDAADPLLAGRYEITQGRAPGSGTEVAVTPELLTRLGAQVGEKVELSKPAGTYRLVGVVSEPAAPRAEQVFAPPGSLPVASRAGYGAPQSVLYVGGVDPVTWADVLALNAHGVIAYSRAVVLDPPPPSDVPLCAQAGCDSSTTVTTVALVLALALVVVLVALEVALLAGAAFAVGARRQARSLALLAATGGADRDVRRVVLAGGLVLGGVGAVLGVTLGALLGLAAIPALTQWRGAAFPSVDVRPLELLAIGGFGLATGTAAAVLPARTAARLDPVQALQGRRGTVRTPRKVPVIAVLVTGLGVLLAVLGSAMSLRTVTMATATSSTTYAAAALIAGGAGLALVGLIVLSPAVVGLTGRLARFLPLAPRLALRDAARHRGRSAPAVAAVLAAVTGAVSLSLYVASLDRHDRDSYAAGMPVGTATVTLAQTSFGPDDDPSAPRRYPAEAAVDALSATLPVRSVVVVAASGADCVDGVCGRTAYPSVWPQKQCPLWVLDREPTAAERAGAAGDPRCEESVGGSGSPPFGSVAVGGTDVLRALTGASLPDAVAALAAGGVVVSDPDAVLDGKARVEVHDDRAQTPAQRETGEGVTTEIVELPAALGRDGDGPHVVLFSPAAATRLGLAYREAAVVATLSRLPTQSEQDAAFAALSARGLPGEQLFVERGYVSTYGVGLLALVGAAAVVTLGAVAIATCLAQADARPDQATLAAVGAAPRLRRTLAACQALSLAVTGAALGIAAGFVPGVAFVAALPSYELVIPWANLLVILVGLPLLAGAGAWLLSRSRLPMDRRVT